MMLVRMIDYLRERPLLVRRFCYLVVAGVLLWDALLLDKSYAHIALEHLPGFWSLFGLVGCVLLIVVAKGLGALVLLTREDYYDE